MKLKVISSRILFLTCLGAVIGVSSCNRQSTSRQTQSTPLQKQWKLPRSIAIWDVLGKINPSAFKPSDEIAKLLGQSIQVGGFVIQNEANSGEMTDFLLTPVAGGCVHVPPPPPNYMIHVSMAPGKKSKLFYGPVLVSGQLGLPRKTEDRKFYSYEMTAQAVEDFPRHSRGDE